MPHRRSGGCYIDLIEERRMLYRPHRGAEDATLLNLLFSHLDGNGTHA